MGRRTETQNARDHWRAMTLAAVLLVPAGTPAVERAAAATQKLAAAGPAETVVAKPVKEVRRVTPEPAAGEPAAPAAAAANPASGAARPATPKATAPAAPSTRATPRAARPAPAETATATPARPAAAVAVTPRRAAAAGRRRARHAERRQRAVSPGSGSSRTATSRRGVQPAKTGGPTADRDRAPDRRPSPARPAAPRTTSRGTIPVAPEVTVPGRRAVSVRTVASELVTVVPGWVWALMTALFATIAVLGRRTFLLGRRRRDEQIESCEATVRALAAAVEAKDPCTAGHLERVQRLGLLLAQRIVPADAGSREMAHGFLLHDIGKLAVPDAILNKPGRLDAGELAVMRHHPDAGAAILDGVPGLGRALDVVRHHHERWDGGGYPAGLAGEDIPQWARIFSVVDTLDAMTSDRPYAARRSLGEALAEIRSNAGTQFDPAVVRGLLGMERSSIASTLGLPDLAVVAATEPRPLALVGT